MKRRFLRPALVAVAALVAGVAIFAWRSSGQKPAARFETSLVDRGRISAKVTATGTLSALVTVQVGSQVSGRISALYADYNARVEKGQLIARIDPQLFQAAVEQARANYAAARGNLAKSQAQEVEAGRQYVRSEKLAGEKLIAQADLDTAQANAEVARAQVDAARGAVEQARAALHQAKVNLAYTSIVSPTSGVVISRNVDVGQTVAASLQAPTLFVIAEDLAKMQVDTSVAEADVGRLRDGMPASFTVDAYPSEVFRGTVRQIRNSPQTVQNVVTYDAVVDVANPDLKLRPGMTANVTFTYAEKDAVVRIPNAALRFRPPPGVVASAPRSDRRPPSPPSPRRGEGQGGGKGGREAMSPDHRTVWVLKGEQPAPVSIRTGISDGSLTEVVEGELRPGDAVVTDAAGSETGGGPPGFRRIL
jgi:HlyD family secretion protein